MGLHLTGSSLTQLNNAFARPEDGALTAPRARRPVNSSLISGMQSGHGWAMLGTTAASVTDDTSDYFLGNQSVAVVSKTDQSGAIIARSFAGSPIDTTGKSFRVLFKVDQAPPTLWEVFVYASTGDTSYTNYYQWQIVNGGFAAQTAQFGAGEYVWVTLPFSEALSVGSPSRSNIQHMRLRITGQSGTAVTAHWNAVALVPEVGSTAFTNGVVSFTYDDSFASHYTEARKALDTYGYTGTLYTICDLVGSSASWMTVAQLQAMQRSGWEVAAHSYTQADHNQAAGFNSLTQTQVEANLRNTRRWLVDNGLAGGDHIAYPKGFFNTAVIDATRKFHASARTIVDKIETLRPGDPLRLRTIYINNTTTVAAVKARLDAAKANKEWAILTFHDIVTSPSIATEYSIANHQSLVDYVNTLGMTVLPVGQVLRAIDPDVTTATKAQVGLSNVPNIATPSPIDDGFCGESYDVAASVGSTALTFGQVFFTKVTARDTRNVTKLWLHVGSLPSGLTSGQNLMGLFDSTGTLLATSGDLTSSWGGSNGPKAATIPSTPVVAGQTYYVAILCNGTTTPPSIARTWTASASNFAPNAGYSTAPFRFNAGATGQTALPPSVTLTGLASSPTAWWVAMS